MPGLRHVVTLTFADDTSDEQRAAIVDALRALPDTIPEIERYEVGLDAALAADNASIAIVADFASVDDYLTYRDHPAHHAVIENHIKPVLAGRSAVQHERA